MTILPRLAAIAALLLPTASATAPTSLPPSDAFIWQRRWTPALAQSVTLAGGFIRTWHVLAAERPANGPLIAVQPDWAALQSGHQAIPVIRVDGYLDSTALPAAIAARLAALPPAIRRHVEIDYDCPTARLPAYAAFLAALRAALPPGTAIAATVLPTWLSSPGFAAIVTAADSLVLQVHAIDDPRLGLFSAARARPWVARLAAATDRPFLLALPAYGARAALSPGGALLAVTGEAPAHDGAPGAELAADPAEVAAFLRSLARDRPANLRGLVWFRLPVPQDRRTWSLPTLRAVAQGAAPQPRLAIRTAPTAQAGLNTILVANEGDADAILPAAIALPASCDAADGLGLYTRDGSHLLQRGLTSPRDDGALPRAGGTAPDRPRGGALIRAHDAIAAGWIRCATQTGDLHAED